VSAARDEVLGRIRRALGGASTAEARAAEYAALPREYHADPDADRGAVVALFVERLHDYGAAVYPCPESEIAETVAAVLTARGAAGLLVPRELPEAWLPSGFSFAREEAQDYAEMDRSEGVLTACALAIALTGTIVIQHSAALGSRALTLVPDFHLCVVRTEQIVHTVPEGIRAMAQLGNAPLTTISGPSATSDIEMTRIKGVHGPRTLAVILAR
jgi:L-lactate dehydrogenase complex protein LldG